MTECSHCGRTVADGAQLCAGCTTRLRRALRAVPEVVEDLHITLSRRDRITAQTGGGRDAETPLVWKDPASLVLADLHAHLTSWVRCVAEDTGLPAGHVRDTSPACAAWLAAHLTAVGRHPAAADLLDEVDTAVDRGRAACDLPQDSSRFRVGPCPENHDGQPCDGEVWANIPRTTDTPALLRCRTCTTWWDTTQWHRAGDRIHARQRQMCTPT